jgi:mannitol/fructose-specific phosphotransferase system IIA component (Ntr-type)
MVQLTDLIFSEGVFLDVVAGTQDGVLEEITKRMVDTAILAADDQPELFRRLTEREALCSTAVGHGAAIPHAYFDKLDQPRIVIARMKTPLDYCSPDGGMVDLIFVLLGPERIPALHIQVLSKLTRLLKDDAFDQQLRCTNDPRQVVTALADWEERHH